MSEPKLEWEPAPAESEKLLLNGVEVARLSVQAGTLPNPGQGFGVLSRSRGSESQMRGVRP